VTMCGTNGFAGDGVNGKGCWSQTGACSGSSSSNSNQSASDTNAATTATPSTGSGGTASDAEIPHSFFAVTLLMVMRTVTTLS
jgi:hypothetical protein